MSHPLAILRKEHSLIKSVLSNLDYLIKKKFDRTYFISQINKLEEIWDNHEKNEEYFLDWFIKQGEHFPYHKMLVQEHRELRGHWSIINEAVKPGSKIDFQTAMETDGKMLIKKFREHISKEDRFLGEIQEGIKETEFF